MKINELLDELEMWTSNEESKLLKKLQNPTRLHSLSEHDQFRVQSLIRKSLVTRNGIKDPIIVANEK